MVPLGFNMYDLSFNMSWFCLTILCLFFLFVRGGEDMELFFTIEPSDIVAVVASSVVLDCAASSKYLDHPTELKWRTVDGQYLSFIGDPHRTQLSNGSLLLKSVFGDESGDHGGVEEYQCLATVDNIGSIVSRTATVKLARLPPFEKQPSELRVFPGQTALFSCFVEAQPKPKVMWLKDQRPLVLDESRMTILPSGSLEIDEVQGSDKGIYYCNVSALDQHRISEKGVLKIDPDLESGSSLRAPVFIATPHSTVAVEGSTVTLDCAANGTPRPWITWLKDGVAIDLADLDSRCSKIGTASLQISNIVEKDAGNYQCRAENKEDSIEATATLHVQVAPRFLKKPVTKIAREKEDVELECSVYARPEPKLNWLKNGDQIKQNEYLQVVNGNNLRILGLMSLDSGIFQCLASNPAGNIQAAAHLTILKPEDDIGREEIDLSKGVSRGPSAPQNLEAAIVGARFVTLHWKPPLTVLGDISTYSVFYRQEGSDRERVINTTRSRLEEVNIQGLQPDRTYLIRVVAYINGTVGQSSEQLSVVTKAEVHVPGPPQHVSAIPLSPKEILVQWHQPHPTSGPIQGYRLYYVQTEEAEESSVETTDLQYTLKNLNKYAEYNLWVVGYNLNGPGTPSEEISARTYSDVPSEAPMNVTLEAASSTSVIVRWEPPSKDGQNGLITGYKVRYRKKDRKGKADTVTTAGNRRLYAITGLDKSSTYQVRLCAMNVNGTGPSTDWLTIDTYENDLDESTVPEVPSSMKVRPSTDSITVSWSPPINPNIMVRGYIIGWGKGIPDVYSQLLDGKQRYFIIKGLEANSEYVISLRANNDLGDGPPKYEIVRTREDMPPELSSPLIPPVGLKAIVLSSSTVVVYWTDTTLSQSQLVTDNRYYEVRYASCHHLVSNPRYKYYNSSDLNYMIDDLKPNTQYEFTVKVVKGRRESPWSMLVSNTTYEASPSSSPRDLTVVPVDRNPSLVNLNWQPPKQPNGQITGYVVSYTTDLSNRDRDWVVENVMGDKMTTVVKGLTPSTTYYFKVQARNSKGHGPMSSTVSITTGPGTSFHQYETGQIVKDGKSGMNSTMLLLILLICCILLVVGVAIGIAIVCCRKASVSQDRSKKGYIKGNTGKPSASSIKPPDLWIHHDQMELKNMEKSSQGSLDAGPPRDLDPEPTRHHPTSSLEKRTYVSSYTGNASQPLLLPEEKTSTARRIVKPKPIALPVENQPLREPIATTTLLGSGSCLIGNQPPIESRPLYPRTQYSISRAHVTLDPAAVENQYVVQAGVGAYESVPGGGGTPGPPAQSSNYGTTGEGVGSIGKRLQGHPLKSFSVPAPPPQSAPSTPQQKHVVTVRPQGSSPYKKVGHYAGSVPHTSSPGPVKNKTTLEEPAKLQPSYSTEELNQEMANLEGLMKDLNAITASEFEC